MVVAIRKVKGFVLLLFEIVNLMVKILEEFFVINVKIINLSFTDNFTQSWIVHRAEWLNILFNTKTGYGWN